MNSRRTFGHVFHIEATIAAVVFALIGITVVVALVRSRARRGREPSQKASHPRIEAALGAAVAAVVVFVILLSVSANSSSGDRAPSLQVSVTAFQWCWRFSYQGTDVSVTADCVNGDIPTLELPVDRVVRIHLTSADVIHSMWVPYLRFKMQAFPDHVSSFDAELSTTGSFPGRCAEFCGLYHYSMDFTVKAVPPAQFTSWLRAQERGT